MSAGKAFLDTNILLYCFDESAEAKGRIARELIERLADQALGVISYQVRQEFASVTIRRIRDKTEARQRLRGLDALERAMNVVHSSDRLYRDAIYLWDRYGFSWYDALIVAAATRGGCDILYSEDLQDGLVLDKLRVVNPFR